MTVKGLIRNQKVTSGKVECSREFRKGMTDAEKSFWNMVHNRKMFGLKFRRQQIIDGFIVDFYCDSLGLCIEIDGSAHDAEMHIIYDSERDKVLSLRGLKIIRFSNDEVLYKQDMIRNVIQKLVQETVK